ncbi:MAG: hypothetical protein ACR2O1_00420 [Boseongicola sp.]
MTASNAFRIRYPQLGGRDVLDDTFPASISACAKITCTTLILSACDQYGNFDLGSENAAAVFNTGANVVLAIGGAPEPIPLYD